MTDLAKLEAFIAITEVKARYCRCLDTKDWAGFADVFTEDFALDTSPAGGPGLIRGRDAVLKMIRGSLDNASTSHQVHTPEITLEGADAARVIWAMQDRVAWGPDRRPQGSSGLTGYGHYHERYVRKDGRWRIAAQTLTRTHVDYYYEDPKS